MLTVVTVHTLMAWLKGIATDHGFLPTNCSSLGNAAMVAVNYDFLMEKRGVGWVYNLWDSLVDGKNCKKKLPG